MTLLKNGYFGDILGNCEKTYIFRQLDNYFVKLSELEMADRTISNENGSGFWKFEKEKMVEKF